MNRRPGLIVLALATLAALPAAAQNAANGQTLYMNNCRACHFFPPSGGPDRAAGNPVLIQSAMNRVAGMSFLRGILSDADVRDIAQYLLNPVDTGPPPPPPPPPFEPATPVFDVTDLWWNPQEPGWGLNLIQHATHQVFGVMYTYDTSRRPLWLVMAGGRWNTGLQFEGDLYRTTGPQYDNPSFDAARVRTVKVGTMTVDFNSRDAGTVTLIVEGLRTAKPIARQPF